MISFRDDLEFFFCTLHIFDLQLKFLFFDVFKKLVLHEHLALRYHISHVDILCTFEKWENVVIFSMFL